MIYFRFIVILICAFFLIGCSSIPRELQETGAIVVNECDSDFGKIESKYGFVYLSIENAAMAHDWYFKLDSLLNEKYIIDLPISTIAIPKLTGEGSSRYKARVACYQLPAGEYKISHLVGKLSGNAGRSSLKDYSYTQKFRVIKGEVLYLGRYIVYDVETRGKGYFSSAGTSFKKMLSFQSMLPSNIEVDNLDKHAEDSIWLRENHKNLDALGEALAIKKIDKLPSAQTYNQMHKD